MNNIIFLYITNPSLKTARKIARHLLRKKLIACANIYNGVVSIYPWKGKIVEEREAILIAKTTKKISEKARREIEKTHPYIIPCIIKIPASANRKYFDWLKKEVLV